MDSLIRRMREFALDLLDSQGIEFELRTPRAGEDVQLSLQARRQLFLIFKECIHNAARHSRCSAVIAEMKVVDRDVLLTVDDNGAGVSLEERAPGLTGGMGIPNMRKRAESLGGRMQLTSKAGVGCCVTIHIPARHGVLARRG
jgi:signal transduction histidine kinase